MTEVASQTNPALVADTKREMLRRSIGEHLGYLATHIACGRMYADIGDDAGLAYALDTAKAYMRAALEAGKILKTERETSALSEQVAVEWRAERDRRKASGRVA